MWQPAIRGSVGGMTPADLLTDAFGRIRDGVHRLLADLDDDALAGARRRDANTIGWLVWHLLRVQDDHVADVAGTEQVWTTPGLRRPGRAAVRRRRDRLRALLRRGRPVGVGAELLGGTPTPSPRPRWPTSPPSAPTTSSAWSTTWDPPVTLGVRLVSVIGDDLQHLGQAAYVKGLLAG